MTAQGLIDLTLGDIGVLAPGEAVSADDSAFCLAKLNALIASLSAQALPIYQITRRVGTLTPGSYIYTIGAGMLWNFARPVKIKSAVSWWAGHEEPITIVQAEDWAKIPDKSTTANWPKVLYYNNGYPTGLVYLWPIPIVAGTIPMDVYDELGTLATLGTVIALPPGYERMLATMLAVEISGAFGKPVTEVMVGLATDAKTSVFGLNQAILGHPSGQQPTAPPAQ